jgi:uncharacterized protein (DUF2147 family)
MKMKKYCLVFLCFNFFFLNAQSIIGKWKTIDDVSGKPKSIVEIYEYQNKIYGKIIDIIDKSNKDKVCQKCSGADKNKPLLGLVIIKGLTLDNHTYNGGRIIDPESGNSYKCEIKLSSANHLEIRGYLGISLFGRSQTWVRN